MNSPQHFRFLNEHVEEAARRTPAVLYSESRHFWDDILEACDRQEERHAYWLFASRWVREALIDVMNLGSVRALRSILQTLRPELDADGPQISNMKKRVLVAHLLPILMQDSIAKIHVAAGLRYGGVFQDAPPSFHPEDY
jgi:hypothetical protein